MSDSTSITISDHDTTKLVITTDSTKITTTTDTKTVIEGVGKQGS